MQKKIEINPSARNALLAGHPWIFSGKVLSPLDGYENGETVQVYCEGKLMGTGFVSPKNSICIRMVSRQAVETNRDYFVQRFLQMQRLKRRFIGEQTNMYRLCFSESDFIPGLIVDNYNRHLVIQTNSAGAMKNRDVIADALIASMKPLSITDRTDDETFKTEHFKAPASKGLIYGEMREEELIMKENGVLFYVDVKGGHKTGFYLDQRENRETAGKISSQKSVLNLCSYTGGFTIYSLIGGAARTVSVDVSAKVLSLLDRNVELNRISADKNKSVKADVFDFVTNENLDKFDVIIIDPPAFAKHVSEVKQAEKAYRYINSAVLKKAKSETFILTSSCTSVVDQEMFADLMEKCIRDSQRDVRIVRKTFLPPDHPALFHFKEGEYLKSFLLYVI